MAESKAADAVAGEEHKTQPLYGGAMRAFVPKGFLDVSKLRDVPDHQEVFVNNDSDCSVIFELNARVEEATNETVAKHIFSDLAEYNDATGHSVIMDVPLESSATPNFGNEFPKRALVGTQTVAKHNDGEDAANFVRIYMAVIRLPAAETDVTIMMNVPTSVSDKSASYGALKELADVDEMAALFMDVVASFAIDDMSIFV